MAGLKGDIGVPGTAENYDVSSVTFIKIFLLTLIILQQLFIAIMASKTFDLSFS